MNYECHRRTFARLRAGLFSISIFVLWHFEAKTPNNIKEQPLFVLQRHIQPFGELIQCGAMPCNEVSNRTCVEAHVLDTSVRKSIFHDLNRCLT